MREAILLELHSNMPAVHAGNGCIECGRAIDAKGTGWDFSTRRARSSPSVFIDQRYRFDRAGHLGKR